MNILSNRMDNIFLSDLRQIIGTTITYSRAGGGVGSILLIKFSNNNRLWIWRYWELLKNNQIIATEEDDNTAMIGKIAIAAVQLENKSVENISINNYNIHITFSNGYSLFVYATRDLTNDLPNWKYSIPSKNLVYEITSNLNVEQKQWSKKQRKLGAI